MLTAFPVMFYNELLLVEKGGYGWETGSGDSSGRAWQGRATTEGLQVGAAPTSNYRAGRGKRFRLGKTGLSSFGCTGGGDCVFVCVGVGTLDFKKLTGGGQ